MNADASLHELRMKILTEIACLAFEGKLDEEAEFIPERIIPGTIPHYRCCVYKEREIVRIRVRLGRGLSTGPVDRKNFIQVIEPACADCPISAYQVTDNCQNCLGKSCIKSCRFGAIQPGKWRSHIDPNKCRECGQCAKSCPYNAIVHLQRPCKSSCPVGALTYDENGLSVIDDEKCIRCGQCVHHCPFGAIGRKNQIVPVIEDIKNPDQEIYAVAAPAIEGQFGKSITMASWRKALKELGFTDFVEVGLGGDLTTSAEAEEWYEAAQNGEHKVTSCCPAFVNMIRKHYPKLSDWISTSVSPMCQVSRMIKAAHPGAKVLFIGPCMAKRSEIEDQQIEGNADYVFVFDEIQALMNAKGVKLEPMEESYQKASLFGKRYANAGGVANSVLEYLKETGRESNLSVARVSGGADLKKNLTLANVGRMKEEFMEGMVCEGGCFHGPGSIEDGPLGTRNRSNLLSQADSRSIVQNLKGVDLTAFSRFRDPEVRTISQELLDAQAAVCGAGEENPASAEAEAADK